MVVTNADNQSIVLKEKVKNFYLKTLHIRDGEECPVRHVFAVTVDKWSLFCAYNLGYHGTLRFSELREKIDGISPRMLSVTLKKLEKQKLITRKVYPVVPPKVEYSLTDFGKQYAERLVDLNMWLFEQR